MSNELISEMIEENTGFIQSIGPSKYDGLMDKQSPKITLLTCADSRVPVNVLRKDTINNVFSIENIGNQMKTSEGSVDYGVLHLKTPLLVVLGHTDCGAIKACFNDFSNETKGIVRELEFLSDGLAEMDNSFSKDDPNRIDKYSELNVDYQVGYAVEKYEKLVESGDLAVIGMIMDFKGVYGGEKGKVYIINFNGEKSAEMINKKMKDKINHSGFEKSIKRLL